MMHAFGACGRLAAVAAPGCDDFGALARSYA